VDVIVDSSLWIAALGGETIPAIEDAFADGTLVLSPLVVAELLSGEMTLHVREFIGDLLQNYPMHETPLAHWMAVGGLRRMMRKHGVNVTLPDAHVAQCALDLDATLLSRDDIFVHIAKHTPLHLQRTTS
jgi:predicted nucleic acid-binding protein